jgi:spore coat protein U-like protein
MRRPIRRLFMAMGWLAALGSTAHSQAATCTVSATGVAFGTQTFLVTSPSDSTGSITVDCDAVAAYSIGILGGNASTSARVMTAGGYQLGYNLYTDATRAIVWGDGSAGSARVSSAGTEGGTHTVYGRIPAKQNVPAGSYSDSLIVRVEF